MADIYDERLCRLGEGPFWHSERAELFWFDILSRKLHTKDQEWRFEDAHSAAALTTDGDLLVASETGLYLFDLETSGRKPVIAIEADNPVTRSNDGRVDPQGGFWIGTMGWNAEAGAGAIYRFYKGEVRCLFPGITISNSICFAPDGRRAYFSDTPTAQIMSVSLDPDGWPVGAPEVFVADAPGCDGAICDGEGFVWSARWGDSCIIRHAPDGGIDHIETLPAPQVTCPALSPDGVLYATTAYEGLDVQSRAGAPYSGATFEVCRGVPPRIESRVIL
ncbi:L-arabinolactonase [Pontivivens insulae]|uniref:L-arabinolactonase n=1 Tax=Pontivivens insulae TaxID=1639689 RepID=A0A2R8AE20_9RHOB|nr:sugar lactone lactonase YvrE [Pontivivens insulae]SPF30459.1 L-arabinolactonase [Pontivivens insulae]